MLCGTVGCFAEATDEEVWAKAAGCAGEKNLKENRRVVVTEVTALRRAEGRERGCGFAMYYEWQGARRGAAAPREERVER